MSEYKEFWIAQGSLADIVCYNEKQAIDLQWTKNPIHVIEYEAFEKLQKDWEQAATQNYADKCEIEKLKKQNEIMREALSFYANDINWNETEPGFLDRIDSDDYSKVNLPIGYVGGKRARQALKDVDTL